MVTTPIDDDADPERFRLASRLTREHLVAERSLHELLAVVLAGLGARRILDIGCGEGALRSALPAGLRPRLVGLDASPTMLAAHPPPVVRADATALPFRAGVFDAEDGPGLVASVFGQVHVERWDAPLVRLPDRAAVRDCLVARFVPHQAAVTAAEQVTIPAIITKRGAPLLYARKARRTDSNSDPG